MHARVVAALACPHDGGPLTRVAGSLTCPAAHRFDLARQGYVNLLTGRDPGTGDDAAMVAARAEVLAGGRFTSLTTALVDRVAAHTGGHHADDDHDVEVVVDLGAGTGHHLAAVVDADARRVGVALDLSRYAARRAARSHPRVGAVVADVWHDLPVRTGVAAVVLCLFAPRNGTEIARVLRPGGVLVVATPTSGHLAELVEPFGEVAVDPDKERRLAARLHDTLAPVGGVTRVTERWQLDHAEAAALLAMGPSGAHLSRDQLGARVAAVPAPLTVTCDVELRSYTPR